MERGCFEWVEGLEFIGGKRGKPELRRVLPKGYLIGGPKMSVGAPRLLLITVIFAGVEGIMNLILCRRNSIHRAFSWRYQLEPCKLCFCEQWWTWWTVSWLLLASTHGSFELVCLYLSQGRSSCRPHLIISLSLNG